MFDCHPGRGVYYCASFINPLHTYIIYILQLFGHVFWMVHLIVHLYKGSKWCSCPVILDVDVPSMASPVDSHGMKANALLQKPTRLTTRWSLGLDTW